MPLKKERQKFYPLTKKQKNDKSGRLLKVKDNWF